MTELVPSSGQSLPTLVSKRAEIAIDTVATLEQKEIMDFFLEFPRLFRQCLTYHYPVSDEMLSTLRNSHAHGKENIWGWMSQNKFIHWSQNLLSKYSDELDWKHLCRNSSVPWNTEIIDEFCNLIDWSALSSNQDLPWSELFIHRYANFWDWVNLSGNRGIPWTSELLESFLGKWDWNQLSQNGAYPWCQKELDLWKDNINWASFSCNNGFVWSESFVFKFSARLDWVGLSGNSSLPWSDTFLDAYLDRWDWQALSCNSGIDWSIQLAEKFEGKIWWNLLAQTRGRFWTPEFIARFKDCFGPNGWCSLWENESVPWTRDLMHQYKDPKYSRMYWKCRNKGINWTDDLIMESLPTIDWFSLAKNPSVPWTRDSFRKYYSHMTDDGGDWKPYIGKHQDFGVRKLSPSQISKLLNEIWQ